MGMQSFLEGRKGKIIVISLILVLSIIYFANLLTPQKMIYGTDWILSGYSSLRSMVSCIAMNKRLPMWDRWNFSGFPIMATSGGGELVYPLNIFYFVFPDYLGRTILFLIHTFLAGLGMWLLLREFRLSVLASLFGAISFMFAGQLISTTYGGHLGRMIGGMTLPFAFLFLHKALRTKRLRDFVIFGGITGLFFLAGHVQINYWGMIGIVAYFVYYIIRERAELKGKGIVKMGGFFIAGMIILLFIFSIHILPPALSLGYGARGITRGYEYTTSWSLPTAELLNLITPHFSGILNNYWGENYFKLDSRYLGILPIILMGFAFFYKKDKHLLKYFALFTGITLVLALGKNTPLFRIYYYLAPMANKFRAPAMFFFLTTFGISVLSSFGAQALMDMKEDKNNEIKKRAGIYLLVFGGLILIATLIVNIGGEGILKKMSNHFVYSWSGFIDRGTIQHKISLMIKNFPNFQKNLWITTLLFLINGGLLLAVIKRKFDFRIIFPILMVVLLMDQWSVDKKYLKTVASPGRYFAPDGVTQYIARDKGIFRVYPLSYEQGKGGYLQINNIENVGGYGPNPPMRYQEFIGAGRSVIFNAPNFMKFPHLLSMLNVKYIIAPRLPKDLSQYSKQYRTLIEQYAKFYSNFEPVWAESRYQVLRNNEFLPRVSLIYQYTVANSAKEALNRILSPAFKVGSEVILEEKPLVRLKEGEGTVTILEYGVNERILNVNTNQDAFLLIRENYHPHWKCYIDGKREKVFTANYIFYGAFIPPGEHRVRFVYESSAFNISALLSLGGFLLFLIAVFFSFKKPLNRPTNRLKDDT